MSKHSQTIFGRRLRTAREFCDLPQDKLGVLIGLDEGCSSARISRYETGAHEPPFSIAVSLARVLKVPVAYFYCPDDEIAQMLLRIDKLSRSKRGSILKAMQNLIDAAESNLG